MKKLTAVFLTGMIVTGLFTGCGASDGKDIGKDAALETALKDANVAEADTSRLRISEDRDDGRKVYEIQFDTAEKEYDYEIQASDGTILNSDIELLQNNTNNQNTEQNAEQNTNQNTNGGQTPSVPISQEQAIATALERVPGATENDIRIKLDQDDGQYKYEGDIIYEQKEYEFEISADTGAVLEWSEDRI